MATWYPGSITYQQWCQAESFLSDVKSSFDKQSNQFRKNIHEQTSAISDHAKTIVASNEQIVSTLEDGFDRLSNINKKGFGQVVSAIQEMHSDLNYNFGILIQKIEYQNSFLNSILNTLQAPFETQVREFYSKGCLLTEQGILDKAADYFNKSLTLPTGDIFFPSYYQLGRLYLSGKEETANMVDPQKANKYLLIANKYGIGILKTNETFKPILADCNFFISQSYYFQVTGKNDSADIELLNNAIKYGKEAIMLNPSLSQGFYHLAKYYSCLSNIENLLLYLTKAIEIDKKYSIEVLRDLVFKKNETHILSFLSRLKESKRDAVEANLNTAKGYLTQLEQINISKSPSLYSEFQNLSKLFLLAERDFKTQTYFGFVSCQQKLDSLQGRLVVLLEKRNSELESERKTKEKQIEEINSKKISILAMLIPSVIVAIISINVGILNNDGGLFRGLFMQLLAIASSIVSFILLVRLITLFSYKL